MGGRRNPVDSVWSAGLGFLVFALLARLTLSMPEDDEKTDRYLKPRVFALDALRSFFAVFVAPPELLYRESRTRDEPPRPSE